MYAMHDDQRQEIKRSCELEFVLWEKICTMLEERALASEMWHKGSTTSINLMVHMAN